MAEVTYGGWSLFDKATIVEKWGNWGGKMEMPQGYVCDSNNKKMLEAAKSWARWYEYPVDENGKKNWENRIEHEGICHEFDNSGFVLELLDCAQDSSQGGKLSFWNCRITKGEQSWKIGIAADLLLDVLKNTTFINGLCTEPLFFARKSGKVGLLCKSMDAYKQATKDVQRKADVRQGKTKKYVEGQTYETLTLNNVYLGCFYQWFTWEDEYNYWNHRYDKKVIKKLDKPQKVYWLPSYEEERTKRTDYQIKAWDFMDNCPARKPGVSTVEVNGSLDDLLAARRTELVYNLPKQKTPYHFYLDKTWFLSTSKDEWVWPEGMKEALIANGWTVEE